MKNREIEFRGLRTDGKGWVYGVPYFIQEEEKCFIINNCQSLKLTQDDSTFGGFEVIPETVGQYTGLKDKNGVKMFEWDIYIHNRRKFVIVFTKNCGIVSVEVNNNLGSILHDRISMANHNRRDYVDIYGISKYIEVIGNIHENKEMQ